MKTLEIIFGILVALWGIFFLICLWAIAKGVPEPEIYDDDRWLEPGWDHESLNDLNETARERSERLAIEKADDAEKVRREDEA